MTRVFIDALDFMKRVAHNMGASSLLYLDPPCVQKGPGLYEGSFTDDDHRKPAKSIRSYEDKWMVIYDTDGLVDEL